jgi:CrcB protein
MTLLLAVAIGGAIGAPLRYLLERWVGERTRGRRSFPWGLLVVNGVGSAIAGIVVVATTGDLRVLLLVGFCGALTTFSGLAWEADRLRGVDAPMSWLAVVAIPAACIAAFWIAWRLAAALVG